MPTYEKLLREVNYAKRSLSSRDLLFQSYGAIKMAWELKAITLDEFFELNRECVFDGINNPKYF